MDDDNCFIKEKLGLKDPKLNIKENLEFMKNVKIARHHDLYQDMYFSNLIQPYYCEEKTTQNF